MTAPIPALSLTARTPSTLSPLSSWTGIAPNLCPSRISFKSNARKRRLLRRCAGCLRHLQLIELLTLRSTLQPKFLTKEERAKLAIAKRSQEIKEDRERQEASRRDRETLESQADELAQRERNSRYGGGGGGGGGGRC